MRSDLLVSNINLYKEKGFHVNLYFRSNDNYKMEADKRRGVTMEVRYVSEANWLEEILCMDYERSSEVHGDVFEVHCYTDHIVEDYDMQEI